MGAGLDDDSLIRDGRVQAVSRRSMRFRSLAARRGASRPALTGGDISPLDGETRRRVPGGRAPCAEARRDRPGRRPLVSEVVPRAAGRGGRKHAALGAGRPIHRVDPTPAQLGIR